VTDVVRIAPPTLRPARELRRFRWMFSILAVVAVCLGTVTFSSRLASASTLGTDRARANQLLKQINRISAHVDYLGQKYDLAKIKLDRIASEITNTKADVAVIKTNVARGDRQLRAEAIFAYVTNGAAASNNPSSRTAPRRSARPTCTTSWPRATSPRPSRTSRTTRSS